MAVINNSINAPITFMTTKGGTGLSSYTSGDTLYFSSGTSLSKLAIGAANTVNISNGTAPAWVGGTAATNNLLTFNGTNVVWSAPLTVTSIAVTSSDLTVTGSPITTNGTINLVLNTVPTTKGGTGLTSYTAGDMTYYSTSTALSKLAISTKAGAALVANPGLTAPGWTGHGILSFPTIVTSTTGTTISTGAANNYVATGMPSITITTSSANSVVVLSFSGFFSGTVNPATNLYLQWRRGGTALAGAIGTGTNQPSQIVSLSYSAGLGGSVANISTVTMNYVDTPGSAGTYTYQIYTAASTAPSTNSYIINENIAGTSTGCMVMTAYEIGGF